MDDEPREPQAGFFERHRVAAYVAIVISVVLFARLSPGIDWNDRQVQWKTFDEGSAEAAINEKPIFLLIYADWCGACKRLSPIFENPEIIALSRRFVMIRVDGDKEDRIGRQYSPDGEYYPRILFLNSVGIADLSIHADDDKDIYYYDVKYPEELIASMKKAIAQAKE